jgi:DedD protein
MKWAFWRRDPEAQTARGAARRSARDDDADPGRVDPATALKIRARRRLIGAAMLLLAAAILVPMVLDPAPRPVPATVPIDIPSEKTPFTPRLPLPPVPDPAQVQGGPPPEASEAAKVDPKPDAKVEARSEHSVEGKVEQKAEKADKPAARADTAEKSPAKSESAPKADAGKDAEAERARAILEGKSLPTAKSEGKFVVQAAAPRSEQAARELAAKLKKAGLPSFTERVQASDGTRWRVRVGPYATRQDAERARARLREMGVGADLVAS